MDFLTIIMIIAGLFSSSAIYVLITNVSLSWKNLLITITLFEVVLISFNILFSNTYLLQNYGTIYIIMAVGFLLVGTFSIIKSTRENNLYNYSGLSTLGEVKKILHPVALLLLLFIPPSVLQIFYGQVSIYLIIIITISIFVITFFVTKKSKSQKYQIWEILGIINIITAFYLVFSFLLPGNYSFQAELFTPDNSGINTFYVIILALALIIIFSIGFFVKPKRKETNNERS